jgi:hypothetical protein
MNMNKLNLVTITALIVMSINSAHAKGPSENASTASKHSLLAGKHSLKATGQVASGVVAVPLLVVGSVGALSLGAGSSLMESAAGTTSEPLEVSEVVITADKSPAEAMKK